MLVKFVEMIAIIGSLNTTISERDNYTSEHVYFVWRIFMPYKQKIQMYQSILGIVIKPDHSSGPN